MRKLFLRAAILLAMTAVILGAFAAHTLSSKISPDRLDVFQTGVKYQIYHALSLMGLGIWFYFKQTSLMKWTGWLWMAGILCFSGSLYFLAVRDWLGLNLSWLGPITPIGGLLFISGWLTLFLATFQENGKYVRKED
ncbi:MAG: DUF423 domain-containing protein [Lewinellaceae bacterium]|nr:DUF423 domain-containing protein [Lewinella sp.]MCB9281288.1 DUF423 domain-containing protein [Lewinellaceae bacterium]